MNDDHHDKSFRNNKGLKIIRRRGLATVTNLANSVVRLKFFSAIWNSSWSVDDQQTKKTRKISTELQTYLPAYKVGGSWSSSPGNS